MKKNKSNLASFSLTLSMRHQRVEKEFLMFQIYISISYAIVLNWHPRIHTYTHTPFWRKIDETSQTTIFDHLFLSRQTDIEIDRARERGRHSIFCWLSQMKVIPHVILTCVENEREIEKKWLCIHWDGVLFSLPLLRWIGLGLFVLMEFITGTEANGQWWKKKFKIT